MSELVADVLVEVVCRRHCAFFKPWKVEEERCGGYEWLLRHAEEQCRGTEALESCKPRGGMRMAHDALIGATICAACAFRAADCDFRDPNGPADAPPCGGILAIELLLEEGHLQPTDLDEDHVFARRGS